MAGNFKWDRVFDRNLILRSMSGARTVKEGSVSFNSAIYRNWLPILEASIIASKAVANLKYESIKTALWDADLDIKIGDDFLVRCEAAFSDLKNRAKQEYLVCFPITYRGPALFESLRISSTTIQWQRKYSSRIQKQILESRGSLSEVRLRHGVPDDPEDVTLLTVKCSAYNPLNALEESRDHIDCMRGVLNLLVNSHRKINMFADLAAPHAINRFRNGHTRLYIKTMAV